MAKLGHEGINCPKAISGSKKPHCHPALVEDRGINHSVAGAEGARCRREHERVSHGEVRERSGWEFETVEGGVRNACPRVLTRFRRSEVASRSRPMGPSENCEGQCDYSVRLLVATQSGSEVIEVWTKN